MLAEFAGPDELSARTNADAGAVERRVAAALAARPADVEERDVYVKSVAPQLYDVARAARFKMATRRPRRTRPSRGRRSRDCLTTRRTGRALRASITLGESEPEVASTLAKLAAVSRAAHPSLCACLKTDAILRWLAGLAPFATQSKRGAYATDARGCAQGPGGGRRRRLRPGLPRRWQGRLRVRFRPQAALDPLTKRRTTVCRGRFRWC